MTPMVSVCSPSMMMRHVVCAGILLTLASPLPAAADSSIAPGEGVGERESSGFAVFRWLVALGLEKAARDRLVGQGGSWEQAAVPCERPRVHLALDPENTRFELAIDSRCRGQSHVAEFDGRWDAEGADRLILMFAEHGEGGGLDESLTCRIDRCDDASGEDCIACQPAPDLAFELRVVRR